MRVKNNLIEKRVTLKRGLQRYIARKLGVSDAAVSYVVRGISRSKRIEEEIARILGCRREDLFEVLKPWEIEDREPGAE